MALRRSPLEPAATSVHVLLALVGTLIGLSVIGTIFWSGSVFGFGGHGSCVEAPNGRVPVPQAGDNVVMGVRDGVRSGPSMVRLCVEEPAVGQRVLETFTMLPTFLVLVGSLVLAARLIRGASREGIFTERMAGRLRVLGAFVLAGELVATFVEAQARFWLTNTMLADPRPGLAITDWDFPVLALLLGAVLISCARIMRISSAMRADLEGTV